MDRKELAEHIINSILGDGVKKTTGVKKRKEYLKEDSEPQKIKERGKFEHLDGLTLSNIYKFLGRSDIQVLKRINKDLLKKAIDENGPIVGLEKSLEFVIFVKQIDDFESLKLKLKNVENLNLKETTFSKTLQILELLPIKKKWDGKMYRLKKLTLNPCNYYVEDFTFDWYKVKRFWELVDGVECIDTGYYNIFIDELVKFEGVKIIDIKSHSVSESVILKMESVESLSISHCQSKWSKNVFKNCTKLTNLVLYCNMDMDPNSLLYLTNLNTLEITGTKFDGIETSHFLKMKNLKNLQLGKNIGGDTTEFSKLDDGLFELIQLESLHLTNLKCFTENALYKQKKLKKLYLYECFPLTYYSIFDASLVNTKIVNGLNDLAIINLNSIEDKKNRVFDLDSDLNLVVLEKKDYLDNVTGKILLFNLNNRLRNFKFKMPCGLRVDMDRFDIVHSTGLVIEYLECNFKGYLDVLSHLDCAYIYYNNVEILSIKYQSSDKNIYLDGRKNYKLFPGFDKLRYLKIQGPLNLSNNVIQIEDFIRYHGSTQTPEEIQKDYDEYISKGIPVEVLDIDYYTNNFYPDKFMMLMKKLKKLNIDLLSQDGNIGPQGFVFVKYFPLLESLSLNNLSSFTKDFKLKNENFKIFADIKICELHLKNLNTETLTDDLFKYFPELKSLTISYDDDYKGIKHKFTNKLFDYVKNLERVDIRNTNIKIINARNFKHIEISNPRIIENTLTQYTETLILDGNFDPDIKKSEDFKLGNFKKIKKLIIGSKIKIINYWLTDKDIENLDNLEELRIFNSAFITEKSIMKLKKLKIIELSNCPNINSGLLKIHLTKLGIDKIIMNDFTNWDYAFGRKETSDLLCFNETSKYDNVPNYVYIPKSYETMINPDVKKFDSLYLGDMNCIKMDGDYVYHPKLLQNLRINKNNVRGFIGSIAHETIECLDLYKVKFMSVNNGNFLEVIPPDDAGALELEILEIANSGYTFSDEEQLIKLRNLKSLALANVDALCSTKIEFNKLKSLTLHTTKLGDKMKLLKCPNLSYLDISNFNTDDVETLNQYNKLEELVVGSNLNLKQIIENISESVLGNIKKIRIDAGLITKKLSSNLKKLKKLKLEFTLVGDYDQDTLSYLSNVTSLEVIFFKPEFLNLFHNMKHLKRLTITNSLEFDNKSLKYFKNLEYLKINGVTAIDFDTLDDMDNLKKIVKNGFIIFEKNELDKIMDTSHKSRVGDYKKVTNKISSNGIADEFREHLRCKICSEWGINVVKSKGENQESVVKLSLSNTSPSNTSPSNTSPSNTSPSKIKFGIYERIKNTGKFDMKRDAPKISKLYLSLTPQEIIDFTDNYQKYKHELSNQ